MQIDVWIENHNATGLEPLADLLERLKRSGKQKFVIFLGEAQYKDREHPQNHGWVSWRPGGLFTDPFNGTFFYESDLDIENSKARLLNPGEALHIKYCGEEVK